MYICKNVYECNREINAYIRHPSGFPLLVGVENAEDYVQLLGFIENDAEKMIIRVSDECKKEHLTNPVYSLSKLRKATEKAVAWIGAPQAMMLMGEKALTSFLQKVIDTSISGSVVILCPFCSGYLNILDSSNAKYGKRIVSLPNENRDLPSIELYKPGMICPANAPVDGVAALLNELEELSHVRKIPFICYSDENQFAESIFPVSTGMTAYRSIQKCAPEITMYMSEDCGTDEQWQNLAIECQNAKGFANICNDKLGDIKQLSASFVDYIDSDPSTRFICFAALKVFLSTGGKYLNECIRRASSLDDVIQNIYFRILDISIDDSQFDTWQKERKRLLQLLDENLSYLQEYCDRATIHGKDVLRYLSEDSEPERNAIIHALSTYKYSNTALQRILPMVSPTLAAYLRTFCFDSFNTKVLGGEEETYAFLTHYFDEYKHQKISNSQDPAFIQVVEEEATRRTFTKLPARSMLVKKMDKKVKPYFFDALGVEYLAFIVAKCEEYHIQADIQIGHCNLPSITCKNKEFYDMFPPETILKEDGLDELKHHGVKYDFQTTKEPIHIFEELILLSNRLKKFSSMLASEKVSKIAILSDHGASRLAVTYQGENDKLTLAEKGVHSGRCCPANEDPKIEFATYEDGFAVLANYDRFSGSRKADVETHGGATLEETLVPIIILSAKPKTQQVFFTEETVICSARDGATIKLFVNPILHNPRIIVAGNPYLGQYEGDQHNVFFHMPEIKRKGHYEADVFDGNKKIATLSFDASRKTGSSTDFGF